jgi:beta-galactosidase beta subunit
MFAIFYPNDAHLPSRYLQSAAPVRKIVIKVACV